MKYIVQPEMVGRWFFSLIPNPNKPVRDYFKVLFVVSISFGVSSLPDSTTTSGSIFKRRTHPVSDGGIQYILYCPGGMFAKR